MTDLQRLYTEFYSTLLSYAIAIVPGCSKSSAEDVVQETFVKTLQHVNRGNALDQPRGFLFTTLKNVIIDTLYRGRRNNNACDFDEEHFATPRRLKTAYRADLQYRLDVFRAGIESIPNDLQREVFVRRRIYGETCREISEELGLSEQVVRNYASIAWKFLKDYVERQGLMVDDFFEEAA